MSMLQEMRLTRRNLAAAGGGSGAFTVVDWLHRVSTPATDGNEPTLAQMDSGTYGLATGSWSNLGTPNWWTQESADSPSIPGLGLSGGAGSGASTKNATFDMQGLPGEPDRCMKFTWGSSKTVITAGFAIFIDNDINASDIGDQWDAFRLDTVTASHFFTAGFEVEAANTFKMFARCGTTHGGFITGLTRNNWYWVSLRLNTTTTASMSVFGPLPSLSLVGISTGTRSGTDACTGISCMGLVDSVGHSAVNANLYRTTCQCARFADVYPLLPAI